MRWCLGQCYSSHTMGTRSSQSLARRGQARASGDHVVYEDTSLATERRAAPSVESLGVLPAFGGRQSNLRLSIARAHEAVDHPSARALGNLLSNHGGLIESALRFVNPSARQWNEPRVTRHPQPRFDHRSLGQTTQSDRRRSKLHSPDQPFNRVRVGKAARETRESKAVTTAPTERGPGLRPTIAATAPAER